MPDEPNPLRVAWSIAKARRVARPRPTGSGSVDYADLADVLRALSEDGIAVLPTRQPALAAFRNRMEDVDPDALTADGSLSFWLNLYNAGALSLAADAWLRGETTVLRLPGAFDETWATIAGEPLSLNDIEHGKIRRFGDPRLHAALVCGSVSCPTLRYEPFSEPLSLQLDDQMRTFLAGGGAAVDREAGTLRLSRVFLWYGGDFVRPGSMPTWLPARRRDLARSVSRWLPDGDAAWVLASRPAVEYAAYDWGLACSIA
jgi:hypothetical protein